MLLKMIHRAVTILERHRDKLNTWLDNMGGGGGGNQAPGLMMLTTGLSRPFRQLERLAGAIQEVQQHLEDDHMDRGDTQRSIGFYKESAAEAARARKQKELELEVLTLSTVVLLVHLTYITGADWDHPRLGRREHRPAGGAHQDGCCGDRARGR